MTGKVQNNRENIEKDREDFRSVIKESRDDFKQSVKAIVDNCEKYRGSCQAGIHARLDALFSNTDVIKKDLVRLAIQVAKIEQKLED